MWRTRWHWKRGGGRGVVMRAPVTLNSHLILICDDLLLIPIIIYSLCDVLMQHLWYFTVYFFIIVGWQKGVIPRHYAHISDNLGVKTPPKKSTFIFLILPLSLIYYIYYILTFLLFGIIFMLLTSNLHDRIMLSLFSVSIKNESTCPQCGIKWEPVL